MKRTVFIILVSLIWVAIAVLATHEISYKRGFDQGAGMALDTLSKIMLKQVGMMAMIGMEEFKQGDFSRVEKTNIFGSGTDWLIIGYTEEPFYEKIKHLFEIVRH